MKKWLFCSFLMTISFSIFAEPGVVVDARGKVFVEQAGKKSNAIVGMKFANGAKLLVDKNSSATLMFSNGTIKKLSAGEKFIASPGTAKKSEGATIINGITTAYNDSARVSSGPTVHGMVKAAGGSGAAKYSEKPLSSAVQKQLDLDLAKVSSLELSPDGRSLMDAQVYYRYGQYKKVVELLNPIFVKQIPPSESVRETLALAHEKMGHAAEAEKIRSK